MAHKFGLLVLVFLAGLLVACGQNEGIEEVLLITETAVPPTIPSPTTTYTPIPSPTQTAVPTKPPTATATATAIPTETATITNTPFPTLTPLPTIPPEHRGQVYDELSNTNGGCELPCWWGFEMGKTSLDEIRQFYTSFDAYISEYSDSNGITVLEAHFVDPKIENGEQTRHLFLTQDGVVVEAEIQLKHHPDYQIEAMLKRFGQPADIWMWTIPEPVDGWGLPMRFHLYFPNKGILAGYATGGELIDDTVNGCFNSRGGISIRIWDPTIWDPTDEKGIEDRAQVSSSLRIDDSHPIEEVSNWDVEQFYNALIDPNHAECLETPSNLWPSPW